MLDELAAQLAAGPWALPLLAVLVLGDAFLVIIPGEAAVTAAGALAAATGSPPLVAVIAVAAGAAFTGDLLCYAIGRRVGLERWRWMRHPRARSAFEWAGARLARRTASALFVARFIPFARLALNLTAGATRVPAARYLPVAALAATGWALYQAIVGAVVASIVPGGPIVAVIVSVVVALALGLGIDVLLARRQRRAAAR
ncbi:VTT domain-containing protein [Microbacterium sp. cx-55]|uniref:DedA family protein n=1 Tax=Microbacterium sp. cx-55 TaxID=2875948 RepID=UPI001CBFC38F|nr:VTT domain-containing protein [Microbacterium sp. cx-55]MBZ4488589.1 VTT domain-containing protein [Microbacterium sp. cx-55]UGB36168.1 VTT domain-containing protein [Microbacterium sp. cx-55]